MYKPLYLLVILFFCLNPIAKAQDMDKGFQYLEKGNFAKAETYFEKIIELYPANKTARLCYARAIGLNGRPKNALKLLQNLEKEYPKDFEIRLNYAEALLWTENYPAAKVYYEELLKIDNKSFPTVLGYANTLSSLKKYEKALTFVNQALELSVDNPNAKVSKKYIQLGLANQYLKSKAYEKSIKLLENNLELFPEDLETLLSLANTYIISNDNSNATKVYNQLKGPGKKGIHSILGLSLVAHLNGNETKALELSKSITNNIKNLEGERLGIQIRQRYVQALIWNKLYKEAELYLNELPSIYSNKNWVLGLHAMLSVYKRDFNKSIDLYQHMLKTDSSSFDGNLGLANAYKAIDKYNEAYEMAVKTLQFYENQKDAMAFINQLKQMFYPYLENAFTYSFDNGDNKSFAWSNNIVYPQTSKLTYTGRYTFRKTNNSNTNYEAIVNYAELGLKYRFINTIVFNGSLGVNAIALDSNSYNQLQTNLSFDIKPLKLQQTTIGYSRELESFNAELISERITKDVFFINHNINSNANIGWFNQYFYTSQNDDNKRHLYFTSLYYNVFNKPSVKFGVNYQYITFSLQRPTVYFSPSKFNMVEVFGELMKLENSQKDKSWSYGINTAIGYQYIEEESKQATYRIKLNLGYKVSSRFSGTVYSQKSNIASGNTGGFSYTEVGLKLNWILKQRSVFNPKNNED